MNDPNLLVRTMLIIHVLGGIVALCAGPAAMVAKKGGKAHRLSGKIYFWAMFAIFVTAIGVLFYRPNTFLLVVSIFSFYAALTGYRVLFRKRPERQPASRFDWASAILMAAAGAGFVTWGVAVMAGWTSFGVPASADIRGLPAAFPMLSVAFGLASLRFAGADIYGFLRPDPRRNGWWFIHMLRMLTGYIGTVTAFTAQQVSPHMPPEWSWLAWALPTLIGLPGIYLWMRFYRQRFAAGHQAARVGAAS
ncbi:hypothetical protein K2Z83_25085 [Oscillochloris sp. ZM17-4]|uniref:hypothetical protein n=1 Tax=Oscillochloris sp. ZM17-4 TaxID=2866714 RepID=UPI001C73B316|nr:hypothetical protein [Oscillochloris sp. ZM17-4]MBX0330937.1 hypothetical protein [Oscillochloris sp. ZM17-4]